MAAAWWSDQVALMPNVGGFVNKVHTAICGTCVAVPSVNHRHLELMKSGQMTVKDMKSTSTTPLDRS